MEKSGIHIHITGVVQGVGFRPFVYGLAQRLNLTGWVRNTSAGVDIEADGQPETLAEFARALKEEAPPLARIESIQFVERPHNGFVAFEIKHSGVISGAFQPISPDVSICADCLRELFDPADRRYHYPFINCTNCGPRFTIIDDIPYDRPLTTMASFEMCPECAAEYEEPLDRRFHAQPVACPACGPKVWLEYSGQSRAVSGQLPEEEEAIKQTRKLLIEGKIIAIKGLGGFHLACDATNQAAVTELRRRKLRVDKPFALMLPDMAAVSRYCLTDAAEEMLIESRERPIVVLCGRPNSAVVDEVSPGQLTLGVMLPYTPLHYLLTRRESGFPEALVMTSGNLSEEPIVTGNHEARQRLASLADAFLMHDRDIRTRCDDSVMRTFLPSEGTQVPQNQDWEKAIYPVRRSRGYAPYPVKLPWETSPLLATGAELKNAFCLTNGSYAFLSHHIGDMENFETLQAFEGAISHYEKLFRVIPEALAYDLHPDYLATRYALERARDTSLPAIGVQHHHAHIVAAMAEHGLEGDRPVIGLSFDGSGYGDDGAIWGGEFLIADYDGYQRPYHLDYISLPGGDTAVREPWRLALAWLHKVGESWDETLPPVNQLMLHNRQAQQLIDVVRNQIVNGINSPPTSSMGRLFDAISSLAGVRQEVNFEAQAAVELEALVDPLETGAYQFQIGDGILDPAPLIRAVVADLQIGKSPSLIAARFHNGIAQAVGTTCDHLRRRFGVTDVVLSGGVWQNITLLARTVPILERFGFKIYLHRKVPANDGGLALGQAVIASRQLGI